MSYVSVIWHTCSKQDMEKVFLLQKWAGRVISDAKPRTSSVKREVSPKNRRFK